jgi:hypothetical protein
MLNESGRGRSYSKTLAHSLEGHSIREVLECGCPLPLFSVAATPRELNNHSQILVPGCSS